MKTLKNHREKISVLVKVRMSKIVRTPIKVGVCTYEMYANCRTLIFNPIAELVIPIGIPTKEAKVKTHPVIVEVTISKWSV